jgi:hypothetical protein
VIAQELRLAALHQEGAIMIANGLLGILTGSTVFALATNLFGADDAGVMGPGFTTGMLILLGLGLVGLGIRGRKKNFQGTPIEGRYLALGIREVNLRDASLFQRTRGKEGKHE